MKYKLINLIAVIIIAAMAQQGLGQAKGAAIPTGVGIDTVSLSPGQKGQSIVDSLWSIDYSNLYPWGVIDTLRPRARAERNEIKEEEISTTFWLYKNGEFNVPVLQQILREAAIEASDKAGRKIEVALVGGMRYLRSGKRDDIDINIVVSDKSFSLRRAIEIFKKALDSKLKKFQASIYFNGHFKELSLAAIYLPDHRWLPVEIYPCRSWKESAANILQNYKEMKYFDQRQLYLQAEYYFGDLVIYETALADFNRYDNATFWQKHKERFRLLLKILEYSPSDLLDKIATRIVESDIPVKRLGIYSHKSMEDVLESSILRPRARGERENTPQWVDIRWFWELEPWQREQLLHGIPGQRGIFGPPGFFLKGWKLTEGADPGIAGMVAAWPRFIRLDSGAVSWHAERNAKRDPALKNDFFEHLLYEFRKEVAPWAEPFRQSLEAIWRQDDSKQEKTARLMAYLKFLSVVDTSKPFNPRYSESLHAFSDEFAKRGANYGWGQRRDIDALYMFFVDVSTHDLAYLKERLPRLKRLRETIMNYAAYYDLWHLDRLFETGHAVDVSQRLAILNKVAQEPPEVRSEKYIEAFRLLSFEGLDEMGARLALMSYQKKDEQHLRIQYLVRYISERLKAGLSPAALALLVFNLRDWEKEHPDAFFMNQEFLDRSLAYACELLEREQRAQGAPTMGGKLHFLTTDIDSDELRKIGIFIEKNYSIPSEFSSLHVSRKFPMPTVQGFIYFPWSKDPKTLEELVERVTQRLETEGLLPKKMDRSPRDRMLWFQLTMEGPVENPLVYIGLTNFLTRAHVLSGSWWPEEYPPEIKAIGFLINGGGVLEGKAATDRHDDISIMYPTDVESRDGQICLKEFRLNLQFYHAAELAYRAWKKKHMEDANLSEYENALARTWEDPESNFVFGHDPINLEPDQYSNFLPQIKGLLEQVIAAAGQNEDILNFKPDDRQTWPQMRKVMLALGNREIRRMPVEGYPSLTIFQLARALRLAVIMRVADLKHKYASKDALIPKLENRAIEALETSILRPRARMEKDGAKIDNYPNFERKDADAATERQIRVAILDWDETVSLTAVGYQVVTLPLLAAIIMGKEFDAEQLKMITESAATEGWATGTTSAIEKLIRDGVLNRDIVALVKQYLDTHGGATALEEINWAVSQSEIQGVELANRENFIKQKVGSLVWEIDNLDNSNSLRSLRLKRKIDEITVEHSIDFIKEMYERGIEIHIVSAASERTVKTEVKKFGLDKYIKEENVRGDTGLPGVTKDILIRGIFHEERDIIKHPSEVLIPGDGYIEMNIGKELGATTIGVVTKHKPTGTREKLIEAGAQRIVNDFSNGARLLDDINASLKRQQEREIKNLIEISI